jgi:hypothetical protein
MIKEGSDYGFGHPPERAELPENIYANGSRWPCERFSTHKDETRYGPGPGGRLSRRDRALPSFRRAARGSTISRLGEFLHDLFRDFPGCPTDQLGGLRSLPAGNPRIEQSVGAESRLDFVPLANL